MRPRNPAWRASSRLRKLLKAKKPSAFVDMALWTVAYMISLTFLLQFEARPLQRMTSVGETLGSREGDIVGVTVGRSEGIAEGTSEGPVGFDEGATVGDVGEVDGELDGM